MVDYLEPMALTLPEHYFIRELSTEEFGPLWTTEAKNIFEENSLIVQSPTLLNDEELELLKPLRERTKGLCRVNFGAFYLSQFVGWTWGMQMYPDEFYMVNSAVLPEHRRNGLYATLLETLLDRCKKEGFQIVYSRHHANNNEVIIAKLKAGFLISGMEQADTFGTLVCLKYYFNSKRRKISDFRCGHRRPDREVLESLGLQV
jgi:ribosomal protein S18 acetylase RimI-like enzyme